MGVAEFDEGDLRIENVTGQANVTRIIGKGVKRNIKGTDSGKIEFQGQEQTFDPGEKTIEIPGVAVITKNIVTKNKQRHPRDRPAGQAARRHAGGVDRQPR